MSKRRTRKGWHARLQVERLEERDMLDAAGAAQLAAQPQPEPAPEAWVAVLPNDPSFGSLYGLNNTGQSGGKVDSDIDAPEAWDVTTGSLKSVVAIIDTGIDYRHQDLYKNIWINQGEIPTDIRGKLIDTDADGLITFWDLGDTRNQGAGKITDLNANNRIDAGDILKGRAQGGWADGVSNNGDGYVDDLVGWNFVSNTNDPFDDNSHGTHVAGTIGAIGNNGVGVTGINWKVQMMALKFMGPSGSGSVTGAIAALDYAWQHGAFASNHSWAMGNAYYQPLYDAIGRARAAGHVFVAAAGNGGSDGVGDDNDVTPNFPSNFPFDNVLAVAATGATDSKASFSNYGRTSVDFSAPGLGILSTTPNDKYTSYSGTSMATPHATGVVALVHALHPDWNFSQVIQQVLSTTDPIVAMNGRSVTGGRLNAARAVEADKRDVAGPRVVSITPDGLAGNPVKSLRVTFSEALDPATLTTSDVTLTGPAGKITVTSVRAVSGSNNTQFDLLFNGQSRPGTYTVNIGPDVRDKAGNRMDQDRDGIAGEATQDRFTGQFTINQLYTYNLPKAANVNDNQVNRFKITVDRDISIVDVKVGLVVTHDRLSDLVIHLRGPDGTDVMLTNRAATGTSMNWASFDDASTKTLGSSTSPYNDVFRPEGRLGSFTGKNARGTWELWVEDRAAGAGGRLYQFRLMIGESPGLGASSVVETETVSGSRNDTTSTSTLAFADGSGANDVSASLLVSPAQSVAPISVSPARHSVADPLFARAGGIEAVAPQRVSKAIASSVADSGEGKDTLGEVFAEEVSVEQLMNYFKSVGR